MIIMSRELIWISVVDVRISGSGVREWDGCGGRRSGAFSRSGRECRAFTQSKISNAVPSQRIGGARHDAHAYS